VTQTHRGLFESAQIAASIPIVHKDTVLGMTQLAHASGLYIVLLPTLLVGATAVLLRTFEPAAALDLVERFGCTFAWGLPAMMQFVVEEQVRSPRNVSSVHTVFVGGDSASVALQRRCREIFGVEMRDGYGLTESCPVIINPDTAIRAGSMDGQHGACKSGWWRGTMTLKQARPARFSFAVLPIALAIGTTPELRRTCSRMAGCALATSPHSMRMATSSKVA